MHIFQRMNKIKVASREVLSLIDSYNRGEITEHELTILITREANKIERLTQAEGKE